MNIIKSKKFNENLKNTLQFIALDSVENAKAFKSELFLKLRNIPNFPYKARSSKYYDDENVRDLIYKGYTIPYLIDESSDTIVVLHIFKYQLP
jgi:plasmid stabilization system protein ParE